MKKLFFSAVLCMGSAFCTLAFADDGGDNWHSYILNLTPERVSSIQVGTSGEVVDAQAKDELGDFAKGSVAFMCLNEEMMVAIKTKPGDIRDVGELWDNPGLQNTQATLFIDDVRQRTNGYTWSKRNDILLPQTKSDRSKIYNAVLRGQDVRLRWTRGGGAINLHLPPVDETFKTFGEECGLGVYGKGVRQRT